jgi:ABC-type multidrug transport system ATPase subunit
MDLFLQHRYVLYSIILYGGTNNALLFLLQTLAPKPVPPNKFLEVDRISPSVALKDCRLGDYCPLCRIITKQNHTTDLSQLLCPSSTYCKQADVMKPTICTLTKNQTIEYCPKGSITANLCPAGFYCTSLDNKTACSNRTYCPEGSTVFKICEAGYYCPDPATQTPCPKGHYCEKGSVRPTPCNFFFSHCPPMSKEDSMTVAGAAVTCLVLIGICFVSGLYYCYSHFYIKLSGRNRKLRTMKRIQSPNTVGFQFNSDNDLDYDVVQVTQETQPTESSHLLASSTTGNATELKRQDFYMDFKFHNLGLELLTTGQRVLTGVTGEIRSGRLTCILGQSGAGKSTFLTTLACRAYYGRTVGDIYVNQQKCSLTKFNRSVGFVTQDDIMVRDMTVEETLYFAAKTRLDWKKSRREISEIVDNVIEVLNLNNIRHQRIGDEENRGISGGQRKRVNVGIELVSQPVALMCDEPTSGLDSASSMELCDALKNIARSGVNVIAVIHQPRIEIFESFEQVLLLGQGGRTVYLGEVTHVEEYFSSLGYEFPAKVNPADYLLDITSGTAVPKHPSTLPFKVEVCAQNLPTLWEEYTKFDQTLSINTEPNTTVSPKYKSPKFSVFVQTMMCFVRAMVQQIRSVQSILIDLFLVWIGGLIIAIS